MIEFPEIQLKYDIKPVIFSEIFGGLLYNICALTNYYTMIVSSLPKFDRIQLLSVSKQI